MGPNQTKIYIADLTCLNDSKLFERLLDFVPAYRRDKVLRFKFDKGKIQSLGVGLLLKKACEDFEIPKADEFIAFEKNGKPYFVNHSNVQFNLSHSENRAMCIMSVGLDSPVGCDVEKIKGDRANIAERFFMPEESAWIKSFQDEFQQNDAFYRLWTLKESYMKVTGLGLSLSPSDFSFILNEKDIVLYHNGIQNQFSFWEYDFQDGYKYACCKKNLSEIPLMEKVLLNYF